MAYQTRSRSPLFDSDTQEILEKRGRELIGLALLGAGVALALILGSYVPDDPSWLAATSEPAQNALGRMGASIASPMIIIAGLGAWGIPAALFVWGGRFLIHTGAYRALSRAVFVPIGVALVSVYLATHAPGADWGQSFGLGGMFGDMALGALLGLLGVQGALGLKLTALLVMIATWIMGAFVLGFTRTEIAGIGRWLARGTVMSYAGLVALLGFGQRGLAQGVTAGARAAAERTRAMRDARAERTVDADEDDLFDPAPAAGPMPRVLRAPPPVDHDWPADDAEFGPFDEDDAEEPAEAPGFLTRLGGRLGLAPKDEREFIPEIEMRDEPGEGGDRISDKISDAIRSRARSRGALPGKPRVEPVIKGRKHPLGPQPLLLNPGVTVEPQTEEPQEHEDDLPEEAYEPDLAHVHEDQDDAAFEVEDDEPETRDFPVSELPDPVAARAAAPDTPRFAPRVEREAPKGKVQHAPNKPFRPSKRAEAEAQPNLAFDEAEAAYERPPLHLLTDPKGVERHVLSDEALEENARMLETVLDDYGVKGEIVSVRPGPVVTMYELEPAPGLKASRVIGLADDIARSMSALSARVSTVPGRSVIGIELPNENREICVLREILSSREFDDAKHQLPLALGKDIGGDPIVANLAKMPHLLIAGTTGSGKSVAINTMILSLLYRLTPEECRMIMIDPKMLELSVYDGIPHLLSPVVTDPKKAVVALKWVVAEMEDRYRKMSKMGVRNIEGYNARVRDALKKGELFERTVQTGFDDETGEPIFETEEIQPEILPFIVVVVDEMADLMMVAGKEIEACIQRLAQMARASGIHLIMATQRPSVDVITGTIKANFPTRISFSVTSKIDSRTILGEQGAEQLLGMGDMLYMAGGSRIIRVHGPFCSDEEVEEIVTYLKSYGPPDYQSGVVQGPDEDKESDIDAVLGLAGGGGSGREGDDALYDQAVAIVAKDRKCSTSYIQRKLGIGYNKAARLVEQMEDQSVVSSANHVGKREVLVPEVN
ncbi:DNA translocase FtsK [Palleronia marisminoris]|uniref:DNA translocase FtsK n=1 Tax=Palleronia marisminoris TaxID=315423 RepID=UPI0008EB39F7|nr:DNA translocase FtsK [Palleronia marisminoris]SFG86778.1 DNA translocase FtsK [Palleronia marisminoris]